MPARPTPPASVPSAPRLSLGVAQIRGAEPLLMGTYSAACFASDVEASGSLDSTGMWVCSCFAESSQLFHGPQPGYGACAACFVAE